MIKDERDYGGRANSLHSNYWWWSAHNDSEKDEGKVCHCLQIYRGKTILLITLRIKWQRHIIWHCSFQQPYSKTEQIERVLASICPPFMSIYDRHNIDTYGSPDMMNIQGQHLFAKTNLSLTPCNPKLRSPSTHCSSSRIQPQQNHFRCNKLLKWLVNFGKN